MPDQRETPQSPAAASDLVLKRATELALGYEATIDSRNAAPTPQALADLAMFSELLSEDGADPIETLTLLDSVGSPATMATTGPNYFGFVNGATYPAALGASYMVNTWDQNAALPAMSPVAAAIHDVVRGWLIDVLGLKAETDVSFVTGATVANASCLAAARDSLLAEHDWDVQRDGLFGAPQIQVVIGEKAHSTLRKSLGLIGLGRERVIIVPSDDQGRMRAELLPDLDPSDGPILLCGQAGEVNTGAFDPFDAMVDWAQKRDAWVHVDAAFGLWALADPSRSNLVAGLTRVDSLATDGHKWLNVTYDCGIAFVQRPGALRRTFAAVAGYLPPDEGFEAMHNTPQSSQRARQVEVWAVLRTLGRNGLASMVQTASDCAVEIADLLRDAEGFEILNDVVLNQVLVRYQSSEATAALVAQIQADGRIWCGPTQWQGEHALRVSVSSWKTDSAAARSAAAVIIECAGSVAL